MMILIWLIIGFGIYYLVKNNKNQGVSGLGRKDPIELLKERYAKGEIDDDTYQRMMNHLKY